MPPPNDPPANPPSSALPSWAECECFCIHGYSGTADRPCGWRGRWSEALAGDSLTTRRCPRCGRDTLMTLPGTTDLPRA